MLVIFSAVLLLAGIAVVVMIHVCVVWWTIGRFSNYAAAEDCRNLIKGVSAGELEKLPSYDYNGGEKGKGSEAECAVCLDGFQNKGEGKCKWFGLQYSAEGFEQWKGGF